MISLQKSSEPQWLIDNAATKTAIYLAAPSDAKPRVWGKADVVDALKKESSRKCIYCEQVVDDTGYAAVEHIRPKAIFPDEVLVWENLGLACGRCNSNKGEYWSASDEERLLNPFTDTIEDHIEFRGPFIKAAPGSPRARNTLRKLKLPSREDVLIARARSIEALEDRLRLWHDETDPDKKQLFREDVVEAISESREHTGTLRAYARDFGFA